MNIHIRHILTVLIPLGALAWSQAPCAATQTANSASCINLAGTGTVAWNNPANAVSSNGSYATASVDATATNYLHCTNYGFTIPAGATINGITVNVERRSSSAAAEQAKPGSRSKASPQTVRADIQIPSDSCISCSAPHV